jgi:uncharacterized protein (DUF433 family)
VRDRVEALQTRDAIVATRPHNIALGPSEVPGISYVDGVVGPGARVDGTGLDAFEVIQTYLQVGRSLDRLAFVYDLLTPEHLMAALSFYERFPDEIDERLAQEEETWRSLFGDADEPSSRRR